MKGQISNILIKWLIRLTLPVIIQAMGIMLIIFIFLFAGAGIFGIKINTNLNVQAKKEDTPTIVINGSISNNKTSKLPIFKPSSRNLFYALVAIRGAEANRPDSVYYPNDFTSCGNYQQLMGELIGNNPKANKAKQVLGSEYDNILGGSNSEKIKRWEYQGYNKISGELIFEALYRGGRFVGWARTIPREGTLICKQLVENHLKTGLFDQIALTRLESMGLIKFIESYDLNVNNTYNFTLALCKSQGPVSCLDWVERSQYILRQYLVTNTYENLK